MFCTYRMLKKRILFFKYTNAIQEKLESLNPLVDIEKLDRKLVDLLIEKFLFMAKKTSKSSG